MAVMNEADGNKSLSNGVFPASMVDSRLRQKLREGVKRRRVPTESRHPIPAAMSLLELRCWLHHRTEGLEH